MNRLALIILRNLHRLPRIWWKLCRYSKHPGAYSEQETFAHVAQIANLVLKSGNIQLIATGTENLPADGGFMLYGNHQGLFDVVALIATCGCTLGTVYKKELENVPFLKRIFKITKSFAMDRSDVRQSMTVIHAVTEELQHGRNYLIFPEGTRSKQGNIMGEFHAGSFRCAVKAKCPIVPVAFIDSWQVFDRKGHGMVSPQIHYLSPILYEEYKDMKTTELSALVKSRIQEAIDCHS